MKKKLEYYERHPQYVFPELSWILDRGWFYYPVIIISIIIVSGFIKGGIDAYSSMENYTVNEESKYLPYEPEDPLGVLWAKDFIQNDPFNSDSEWIISSDLTSRKIDISSCRVSLETPYTVMATLSAQNSNTNLIIQTYGAGQAKASYNKYLDNLSSCSSVSKSYGEQQEVSLTRFNNNIIMTSGDAVLFINTSDSTLLSDENLLKYSELFESSLRTYQCVNLLESDDHQYRNIYYHPDDYTGFLIAERVTTTVDFTGLHTPIYPSLLEENDKIEQPEAPLPEGFPTVPEKINKPVIPTEVPKKDDFSEIVKIQVPDNEGPGCGWRWSNQIAPETDESTLEENKNTLLSEAQNRVDSDATDYITKRNNWSGSMLISLPQIYQWNSYVEKLNKVYSAWDSFNQAREDFKPTWDKYISDYSYWYTFDETKASALEKYLNDVAYCDAHQPPINDTTTPVSPSPSPSPSPTVEEYCTEYPIEPSILNEEKPTEPIEPIVPNNITIPDSWARIEDIINS